MSKLIKKTTAPKASDIETAPPSEAWKMLVQDRQEMDEQIFSKFLYEILGMPEDSLLQFYIMTVGMKTPKLGHIKYENFEYLFLHASKAKNIKQLRKALSIFEKNLLDEKVYKEMYNKVFEAFLIKNLSMEFEYAEYLWPIILKQKFTLMPEFLKYLQYLGQKKPLKCHKDLWQMLFEFAVTVKNLKDYTQADGWPVFLDNFVEFMRESRE